MQRKRNKVRRLRIRLTIIYLPLLFDVLVNNHRLVQVLTSEFVLLANEFVLLAIEFLALAFEFVTLAFEFVTLAFEFVTLA